MSSGSRSFFNHVRVHIFDQDVCCGVWGYETLRVRGALCVRREDLGGFCERCVVNRGVFWSGSSFRKFRQVGI